jgi:hypothetical protein
MSTTIDEIELLRAELRNAFSILEAHGVPMERAKTVANGIDVLFTRMNKENKALNEEHFDMVRWINRLHEVRMEPDKIYIMISNKYGQIHGEKGGDENGNGGDIGDVGGVGVR